MTGERAARPLQAGLTLTVNFGNPWKIMISNELLVMISKEVRRTVMNEALDANQRFKVLVEELHWNKSVSVTKLSKYLSVPSATLYWWMKRKMNVKIRDNATALQLANTGRYRYAKRDFDGDDVEKLKLWFLAHTDASVRRCRRQVKVELITPDPYLALLFKEVFSRYGYVGVAPRKDNKGNYRWQLWVYLPFESFQYLLEKHVPTPVESDEELYDAFNIAMDCEGSISASEYKRRRTADLRVLLYNEKDSSLSPYTIRLKSAGTRCAYT